MIIVQTPWCRQWNVRGVLDSGSPAAVTTHACHRLCHHLQGAVARWGARFKPIILNLLCDRGDLAVRNEELQCLTMSVDGDFTELRNESGNPERLDRDIGEQAY